LLQVLDFLVLSLRPAGRVPLVLWTIHNVEFLPEQVPYQSRWLHKLKDSGYRLLYRWLSKYADGFIAVSDDVRRSIIETIAPEPDKIFTICNAVDLKPFERVGDRPLFCEGLGVKGDSHLIASVGRLTKQKGHRYLLEAAKPVINKFPDAHFLLIGDGELRDTLACQAEEIGVAEHLHFLGLRRDVPDLLAAADLFVLPSLWEGLSVALLEAMAAAKPIVASAVPGTNQAMIPGETGLVIPPGDSQALADAIIQLLSDPVRARSMGRYARQHVKMHFGAQKQACEHLALYRHLLSGEAGP
jgi:glycosyltransferase involved in cell wall biosynthesis